MSSVESAYEMPDDPQWYKDAVIYQLHVRGFFDSDGDGIGDFRGLKEKLDYLEDLGVGAIWLLPFYPSPLKDDGYDIADYVNVHPAYGKLQDVRAFVHEAHRRGIRVVTELVCNHTSDRHPWFQRARQAKRGSPWRDFYVWSDTADKYKEARIIFKDFEASNWSWDSDASAYYWHRFYSHQPDLNFDNPHVHRAIFKVIDFWLKIGIDGLRLDAIPYLYEREGTNCENLPETHAFLRQLRRHVDERFSNRMLLAEANQWPEDAVAYFGDGDECQMAFHFPLMPRMFMALYMEDRFPIVDIMAQTPGIPGTAQWALFLRNHDELTLEMVTDEERDYMYRVYARDPEARINLGIRRRLAPLLGNHRRRIELMNGLLFSLPGTPVVYYGDEIGMGDNIYLGDRNGVRTPMQWSSDRNAGFSKGNQQRLYLPIIVDPEYHFETVNVETQQKNQHSLLWWMKRLTALRKRFKAFGRGTIEFLQPENRKVLAFVRRYGEEVVLVVANLSRFVQYTELDLSEFRGMVPVEIFGRTEFPPIGDLPYFITLSPHSFYWYSIERQKAATPSHARVSTSRDITSVPVLVGSSGGVAQSPAHLLQRNGEGLVASYIEGSRWFRGKARRIRSTTVTDVVSLGEAAAQQHILLIRVDYADGPEEVYALPIAHATGERASLLLEESPRAVIARLEVDDGSEGVLYDALADSVFCRSLLEVFANRRRLKGDKGQVLPSTTRASGFEFGVQQEQPAPTLLKAEQSNSSIVYGDRFVLKMFRRLETGVNPDLEIGRFLTERGFAHVPKIAGALEYRPGNGKDMTLALLQEFVPNERDAWQFTLDTLDRCFDRALAARIEPPEVQSSVHTLLDLSEEEPPIAARDGIGSYLQSVGLLGRRTAELHLALAGETRNPDFTPEPFTTLYQRSLFQSARILTSQVYETLRKRLPELDEPALEEARRVLTLEERVLERFRRILQHKLSGMRIRCHGDYHLGQVLHTGDDFVIIDFEGEPARSLGERRIKRSPLRDVAGMLRSFQYAPHYALRRAVLATTVGADDLPLLEKWARFWYTWVSATFLRSYLPGVAGTAILPQSREETDSLLDALLLEKVVYELGYELNNRPEWAVIPLRGIQESLEAA